MRASYLGFLAALSLATASTAAVAQTAATPTVSSVRAGAPVADESELGDRGYGLPIAILAGILLVATILFATGSDKNSASP